MKVKVYLRIAPTARGFKVNATTKPSRQPLRAGSYSDDWLPTVAFAVVFDIPSEAFRTAEHVIAEVVVPVERVQIAAEVEP